MKKRHKARSGYKDYFVKTACYLAILLSFTIAVIFFAINPVTSLVHGIENQFSRQVRDVKLDDSTYAPGSLESADGMSIDYGDKIAVITSDDFSLNCSVYYGSNRITMSNGSGFHAKSDMIGGGTSMISGYLQTCFSGLEHCEKGDIITLTTNYGVYSYRVNEVKYIEDGKTAFDKTDSNRLVLRALTSDFSQHSGESLYVFADMTEREAY